MQVKVVPQLLDDADASSSYVFTTHLCLQNAEAAQGLRSAANVMDLAVDSLDV